MERVALNLAADSARLAPAQARRARLAFAAVNARHAPGYQPGMQRHHLLPRQLVRSACFGALFAALGREAVGFDDFRANGLLLPATERAALASGAPLHRGPHRLYNELVAERVGRIEASWSRRCGRHPDAARAEALMRLRLLQRALRCRLMQRERRALFLSRKDPFRTGLDFTMLDAMVDSLWRATQPA